MIVNLNNDLFCCTPRLASPMLATFIERLIEVSLRLRNVIARSIKYVRSWSSTRDASFATWVFATRERTIRRTYRNSSTWRSRKRWQWRRFERGSVSANWDASPLAEEYLSIWEER